MKVKSSGGMIVGRNAKSVVRIVIVNLFIVVRQWGRGVPGVRAVKSHNSYTTS